MSTSNGDHEKTTEAVLYIWRVISNLSAGSVVALLLSFFIGYRYEKGYLSGIGANWAFDLLSFNEIVLGSLSILAPVLIGFFISLNYLYNFENGLKIVRVVDSWSTGIGFFLYLVSFIVSYYFSADYQVYAYLLRYLSVFSMALGVGSIVVEILGSFRDQELRVNDYIFRTLVSLFITLAIVIPAISTANAQKDLELYDEKLVKTCILSESCTENWYIVRSISDKFLVLRVEQNRQKVFRLVSISDVMIQPEIQ